MQYSNLVAWLKQVYASSISTRKDLTLYLLLKSYTKRLSWFCSNVPWKFVEQSQIKVCCWSKTHTFTVSLASFNSQSEKNGSKVFFKIKKIYIFYKVVFQPWPDNLRQQLWSGINISTWDWDWEYCSSNPTLTWSIKGWTRKLSIKLWCFIALF